MQSPVKQVLLDWIGGEDGLHRLVNTFYDVMESDPEGRNLRTLHARGHGIPFARTALFDFLCGFIGGRRHYLEVHGHMNVKLIHAHVPVAEQDAEDWLTCMDRALAVNDLHGPEIDKLRQVFRRVCFSLINDLGEWGVPLASSARR